MQGSEGPEAAGEAESLQTRDRAPIGGGQHTCTGERSGRKS